SSNLVPGLPVGIDNRAQIVVDRWSWLLSVLGPALTEGGEPGVGRTQPPRCACRHGLAGRFGFVSEVSVPELGIIAVGIEERIGPICLNEIGIKIGRASCRESAELVVGGEVIR